MSMLIIGNTRLERFEEIVPQPHGPLQREVERGIQEHLPFMGNHTTVLHFDWEVVEERLGLTILQVVLVAGLGEPVPYRGRKRK